MEGRVTIGTAWVIPIGPHFSWPVVFGLASWSLAAGYFPAEYPGWAPSTYGRVGAATSLVVFAWILMHELGHS